MGLRQRCQRLGCQGLGSVEQGFTVEMSSGREMAQDQELARGPELAQGPELAPAGRPREGAARAPRSRAYAQARRHSRWVRWLKRAIPLGAVVGIGLVLAAAFLNPFGHLGGLTLGPLSLSGTKVTMENPKLTGFRKDTRPYEVTATAAMQDVRKPNVIELKDLKARVTMDDKGSLAWLEAAFGLFDTQKEQLELKQDVHVKTDGGQDAKLTSASIDFKAGTVVSREPVIVTFPGGTIEADALDVSDNGKVMVFDGRVRTLFEPRGDGPNAPLEPASAPPPARTSQAAPTSLRQ